MDRHAKAFETTAEWMWWRADRLDDVLERIGKPHWSGYAADAFGERLRTVSRACRDATARFMEAREAALKWVLAMWGQQNAADAALDAAHQALEDIARAEATLGLLNTEHGALLSSLAQLQKTQRQYATTPPPSGTRVPTTSEVATARRKAEAVDDELRAARAQLQDGQERLEQAKRQARAAKEEYEAEESVLVRALHATLYGALPALAPSQLNDFVTTVSEFALLPPSADTTSALMDMLSLLKPETLAALLAADPKLAQKFWDDPPAPEKVAAWWKKLSPEARERWCQSAPEVIGNLPGLDADTRIHANAVQLARDLQDLSIGPESPRGKTLKDILAALGVGKLKDGTSADYERLAKALKPPRGLLSYNLRHEPPLAAVAIGDTRAEKSGKVTWMVPGMNSGLGEDGRLKGWTFAGINQYHQQDVMDGLPHLVVAWIGYDPPGVDSVLQGDKARAGGRRLRAELDGQWAADSILGGNPDPFTAVVSHSYGTTVASNAISGLAHKVQSVVFVASAGVEGGFGSGRELEVEGGLGRVYATQSSQDGIAGVGRAYSGRADPTDDRYGARVFSSEGDAAERLEPTDGHDVLGKGSDRGAFNEHATDGHGYFDKDTEALHNTAAAALGLDDQINGGTRSVPSLRPPQDPNSAPGVRSETCPPPSRHPRAYPRPHPFRLCLPWRIRASTRRQHPVRRSLDKVEGPTPGRSPATRRRRCATRRWRMAGFGNPTQCLRSRERRTTQPVGLGSV
ncbi:alpha/beta hydrolase [Leifsonia xyli]|uniref:alpha/beta hydrolase n=1 Tax=Leifsonia xyli TaxID=1575 RepID=UPI003D67ED8C